MIKFEQNGPKEWSIISQKNEPIKLRLSPSSVTNKFFIVTSFIERVAEHHGEAFSEWFVDLLQKCQDPDKRAEAVVNNVEKLKTFSDEYLDSLAIDYGQFVDESKAKKNSILFLADEIDSIIRLSCYLKLYSVISNSEDLALGKNLHKDVYNQFASHIIESEIITKIFNVVKTKTFRYNLTDRFMWDYIKTIQCKDIGIHIIEIFNFIGNGSHGSGANSIFSQFT